jgi:hypothetical protein
LLAGLEYKFGDYEFLGNNSLMSKILLLSSSSSVFYA